MRLDATPSVCLSLAPALATTVAGWGGEPVAPTGSPTTATAAPPASIDVRADRTGLFEVEAHGSGLRLLPLVVR